MWWVFMLLVIANFSAVANYKANARYNDMEHMTKVAFYSATILSVLESSFKSSSKDIRTIWSHPTEDKMDVQSHSAVLPKLQLFETEPEEKEMITFNDGGRIKILH